MKFEELAFIVQAVHELRAPKGGYVQASVLIDIALEAFSVLKPLNPIIVGGFAVAVQGDPRATKDFDLILSLGTPEEAHNLLVANGFTAKDSLDFKFTNIEKFEKDGIEIDLLYFSNPKLKEESVKNLTQTNLFGEAVQVISPEVLLVLKLLSNRPKDQVDVASILAHNPDMDKSIVRNLLQELKIYDRLPAGF